MGMPEKINVIFISIDNILCFNNFVNIEGKEVGVIQGIEKIIDNVPNTYIVVEQSKHPKEEILSKVPAIKNFKYLNRIIDKIVADATWFDERILPWLDNTEYDIMNYIVIDHKFYTVNNMEYTDIDSSNVITINDDIILTEQAIKDAITNLRIF